MIKEHAYQVSFESDWSIALMQVHLEMEKGQLIYTVTRDSEVSGYVVIIS